MEYGLKYQSDFYNIYGKLVSVQIAKMDYGVGVTQLRTQSVEIEVNYQDENTPIIGTGAKVNIINTGAFDSLEDLLTSTEKQFKCSIFYDSLLVFQGFSICDLNEQQFLPWSNITLQFTDYLHRMESDLLDCLSAVGESTCIMEMIQEMVTKIDLACDLYVNSTLFETTMAQGASDTFVEQTYGQNNMFFSDTISYDNTYDAINKILKSFGAHLYFADSGKLILERYDDATRDGDWVLFDDMFASAIATGVATPSLKQEYNKQDGDFKYTESSQVVEYDSGLKKLILQLKDKQFDTFIFNDFKIPMLTTAPGIYFPSAGSLALRTWYTNSENTIFRIGNSFRGIGKYIFWKHPEDGTLEFSGLHYCFNFTFNLPENYVASPDFVEKVTTELTISFTQSGMRSLSNIATIVTAFHLMVNEGDYAGYYIGELTDPQGNIFWGLSATPIAIRNDFDVSVNGNKDNVWSISENINLTDPVMVQIIPGVDGWQQLPSLWDQLGQPTKMSFIISFFPSLAISKEDSFWWEPNNIIGDVQAGITQQSILNKLTYYINADFVKTETLDMEFFDLSNENFANGLEMLGDSAGAEHIKTQLWLSAAQAGLEPIPLMDIFARYKFGNYCKTLHKLKGKIMHDGYLKPFSVLSDDNLIIEGKILKFLLHGYIWDLNNGTFNIEAVEYTEEVNSVPVEDSSGAPSEEEPPVTYYVEVVPTELYWEYDETDTKSFTVLTNMPRWYICTRSYYEDYAISVWDGAEQVLDGVFTSGMAVHVAPLGTNTGDVNLNGYILIANEADLQMVNGTVIVTQGYEGVNDPPVVNGFVGDDSFVLSQFDSVLETLSTGLWIQWTPTGYVGSDWTVYITVTRGGTTVATAQYPHNYNGIIREMWITINELAVAGATYQVRFDTSLA